MCVHHLSKIHIKEKGKKKRVEEISQDERKKIREEERRKIMKVMKRENMPPIVVITLARA